MPGPGRRAGRGRPLHATILSRAPHGRPAGAGTTTVPLEWSGTVETTLATTSWVGNDVEQWQIPLEWSCVIELIPAEDPPPPDTPITQRVSEVYPTPTLTNGRPAAGWLPTTTTRQDWGTLQLIIAGHDRSRPRGITFTPLTGTHTDPFGDGEASFALAGITDFDDPADWGLTAFAPVTLRRKDDSSNFHTLYEGFLASIEPDEDPQRDGIIVHCVGALQRTDFLKEPPSLVVTAKDAGRLIASMFNDKRRRYNLNIGHMAVVTTGIDATPPADFKPFLTGAVQDILSQLTTDSGGQYTVALQRPRTPKLQLRDTTTVHATISYGARGVKVLLSKDFTTATTAVYATGSNGHCTWMGARFPNLVETGAPAFPLAVGHTFIAGDGQTGFAEFAAFLRRGQYGTIVSDDTYDARDVDNVEQFQDRAGITVDGIVGAQTWEAAFQPGANQGSILGAYVDTVWEKAQTRKRLFNAQGADIGANPAYDPDVPRIEDYIPFGDNVSKHLGRKSAKQIVNRNYPAGRTGTIILTADPEEMSRYDLNAGQNIKVKHYNGGDLLLHIVSREWDWVNESVTLTVDEKARDLLTYAAIEQRDKDVADLTRRQAFGRTRSRVMNDYGQWLCEDGAGEIPVMNQQGGFWNVQRIAAAPKGSIERISLAAGTGLTEHILNQSIAHSINSIPGAARAALLIFNAPITANGITHMPGMSTPLTALGDGTFPVDHNQDALNARGLIYAAGGPGNALGFYPNNDPGDGSNTNLTGMFEDGGSVQFGPTGHYWLWVCVWTPVSCKVGGRIFPGPPN
jgi:peptidoglycan hydrolase-like protein with peptidoglycan-binding domain